MRWVLYLRNRGGSDEHAEPPHVRRQAQEAAELVGKENVEAAFIEVEPVQQRFRPQLAKAIRYARDNGCGLVVGDLWGLATNSPFLRTLERSRLPLRFVDLPELEGTLVRRTVRAFRRWSRKERERISERTKEGLERARAEGKQLGGDRGYTIDPDHAEMGREARAEMARQARLERLPQVQEAYEQEGSLAGAARLLNDLGIPTLSGGGKWYGKTVKSVLAEAS